MRFWVIKGADMSTYRNFRDVVIERFRENPEEMKAYLQLALEEFVEDSDTEALTLALRTVAEVKGERHGDV